MGKTLMILIRMARYWGKVSRITELYWKLSIKQSNVPENSMGHLMLHKNEYT
jgi:hypothetical protein